CHTAGKVRQLYSTYPTGTADKPCRIAPQASGCTASSPPLAAVAAEDLPVFLDLDLAMLRRCLVLALLLLVCGCVSIKESDTARTGVEQLLISSAVDRALDKVDLTPVRGAKVFVEPKYLDCVDKNYVLVSLNQRLLKGGSTLVEKSEDADVV